MPTFYPGQEDYIAQLNLLPTASGANTWTQPQTIDVNSASAALTVKQAGAGASLVVTGTGGAEVARVAPGGTVTLGGTSAAPVFAVVAAGSSVNYWRATGGAAGNAEAPIFEVTGADTNIYANLTLKGSAEFRFKTNAGSAEQLRVSHIANAVNYFSLRGGATAAAPTVVAQGTDTTITNVYQTKGVGQHTFATGGGAPQFVVANVTSSVNYVTAYGGATGVGTQLNSNGTDANITSFYNSKATGSHQFWTGGGLQVLFVNVASAVNYAQLGGGTTGVGPTLSAQGASTDLHLYYQSKATGAHQFHTGGGMQLQVAHVASAVNYHHFYGNSTANPVGHQAAGSDTNINSQIVSKGTGWVGFYTGGGAQGYFANTANAVNYHWITGSATGVGIGLMAGGSDPNINHGITSKGTAGVSISTNSWANPVAFFGNVASAVNYATFGGAPASGFSVLAGVEGTSADIQLLHHTKGTYGHVFRTNGSAGQTQFAIPHTAGAVNNLTATGAATGAFPQLASTGTDAAVPMWFVSKGTGGHYFGTSGGTQLLVAHNTSTDYLQVSGGAGSSFLSSYGASASVNNIYGVKSNGYHRFDTTGTGGNTQFLIAHTASAVNYVQVTGSATTISPVLSTQGSDVNVGPWYSSKGNASHSFASGSGGLQFVVAHYASAVNYLSVNGASTTVWPAMAAAGSDINVGFEHRTKGTAGHNFTTNGGVLQFNVAHTASAVNYFQVFGAAAGLSPVKSVAGSDAIIGTILQSKGDGGHRFTTTGSQLNQFTVSSTASSVNWINATGAATTAWPSFTVQGSDTNVGALFQAKGASGLTFLVNGGAQFYVGSSASTVNYLQAKGSATANLPDVSVQGTDTNISLSHTTKGTGSHQFYTGGGYQVQITDVVSAVNRLYMRGSATGNACRIGILGTDANVDFELLPRGSGYLMFGTWTSNADAAVNGYVTIKDAGGTIRKLATIA